MEEWAGFIRKGVTWGTWLAVYFLFVPVAKRRGLSGIKWFFLGVAAMWGTFLVLAASGVAVNLLLPISYTPDGFVTPGAIDRQIWILGTSFTLGWGVMLWAARKLRARPIPEMGPLDSGDDNVPADSGGSNANPEGRTQPPDEAGKVE